MKPTREKFKSEVLKHWPGATIVEADRGLVIVVGSSTVATDIQTLAKTLGLTAGAIDYQGPESVEVRIFGFPRRVKISRAPGSDVVTTKTEGFHPADEQDENLKAILDDIHTQVTKRITSPEVDQAEFTRLDRIVKLALRGLALLAGKEAV